MSDNKQGGKNNMTVTFIALGAALVAGIVIFIIALTSIFSDISSEEGTTEYAVASPDAESASQNNGDGIGAFSDVNNFQSVSPVETQASGAGSQNGGNIGGQVTSETEMTKNAAVEYYEQLSPNGENKLSDHYNNKYIQQIASAYGVDSDLLVAIYSEPDTGNNFVLQFNGEKDLSGNVIKSPDTLEKVYQVDKDGNVSIATGTGSGNVGVSYAEGILCFNMVKTLVMTQYPDYFTGLE